MASTGLLQPSSQQIPIIHRSIDTFHRQAYRYLQIPIIHRSINRSIGVRAAGSTSVVFCPNAMFCRVCSIEGHHLGFCSLNVSDNWRKYFWFNVGCSHIIKVFFVNYPGVNQPSNQMNLRSAFVPRTEPTVAGKPPYVLGYWAGWVSMDWTFCLVCNGVNTHTTSSA